MIKDKEIGLIIAYIEVKKMATFILDTKITILEGAITSMNGQLENKMDKLDRLKKTLSKLVECEEEFSENDKLCLAPELSAKTWEGNIAGDFETIKQNDIKESYKTVGKEQVGDAIAQLEDKIQELEQGILQLENDISSSRDTLNDLEEQKRRRDSE